MTRVLTDDEITALFTSNVMGIHSPEALVNILWFNNCWHFRLRGGKQRDLQWGDIELKTDLNGKEYLEYAVERQTKTRPGDNPANRRAVKPRMFENKAVGPERDPVFVYKLYRSKTVLYIINRKIHGCLEIPHLFLVLNMVSSMWYFRAPMYYVLKLKNVTVFMLNSPFVAIHCYMHHIIVFRFDHNCIVFAVEICRINFFSRVIIPEYPTPFPINRNIISRSIF